MKFFAFIMIVILFAQSFMPCADKACTKGKGEAEIAQATHQQKDSQDDCPALCSCSCCSCFSSANSFVSYLEVHIYNINDLTADFIPSAMQKIALPIWQPPQLV